MKNTLALTALAAAGIASADQGCSGNAVEQGGNWYCSEVKSIRYTNFGAVGANYNRVTSMSGKPCGSTSQAYSGSIAPLNGDVSLHIRGPFELKQFAFYTPGSGNNASANQKRTATERRHAHAHAHAKKHAHHHAEKREAEAEPEAAVGDVVHALIDGEWQTWSNTYDGSNEGKPATAAPSTPAAAPAQNNAPSSAGAAAGVSASVSASVGSIFKPDYSGDWVRQAYYNANQKHAEGVTFLNHMGADAVSGTWDTTFGNSLSYASADGLNAAASPQVLADVTIPSNKEIVLMSDKPCSSAGASCGFSRPGTVAYEGFAGDEKTFLFEFGMPSDGSSGFNADMPALWMLNAQIPRTLQYGDATCSCWATGCGELDLFEVLDSGNTKCKSTLHGKVSGGASDWFARPTNGTIKAAVVMSNMQATIKVIDDSFDFSTSLSNKDLRELGSEDGLLSALIGGIANSLFALSTSL